MSSSDWSVKKTIWGHVNDGRDAVHLYEIENHRSGLVLKATDWGCTIVALRVRGKDVVLGFDTLDQYVNVRAYYGCAVGRFANRIARGQLTVDGKTHQLACNNGANHLHGGVNGFNRKVWASRFVETANGAASIVFSLTSPDGDESFPGTLQVTVTYELGVGEECALHIKYHAVTDKPTVCNLTNHSFFNLNLGQAATIVDHSIQIEADFYTPVDDGLIPTGEIATVRGTDFDFTQPTRIGARANGGFYDHNWVLRGERGHLRLAARLSEPASGLIMTVLTREPGIQFYTGKFIQPSTGKNGVAYNVQSGLCLETQVFPDAPNKPHFPSSLLLPGQTYETETVYRFQQKKSE
jgi:aldose 1-epimerase